MGKIKNNLINGKEHLYPAIAILIILISAFLTLPNRYLWEPDETRFAEIAREMLTTHQWWVLHLNGEVYTQKPPLYIWILAGLRKIGLSWTAAGVLPSLAALTGIFLLLPNFGRVLGITEKDSYFPSLILASFPLMVIMGLAARMDMLLNFFYFSSFFFLAKLFQSTNSSQKEKITHLGFWLMLGLGTLTKGPVAFALPLFVALSLYWLSPSPRLKLSSIFSGWGPLLFFLLLLIWLTPALIYGGKKYLYALVRQTEIHAVKSPSHHKPFYFYFLIYPVITLPWSLVILIGVVKGFLHRYSFPQLFLATSLTAIMLFFSAISSKLPIYLLPLYPLAALLIPNILGHKTRLIKIGIGYGALGVIITGIGSIFISHWLPQVKPPTPLWLAKSFIVILLGAIALIFLFTKEKAKTSAILISIAFFLLTFFFLPEVVSQFNQKQSSYDIAMRIKTLEPDGKIGFVYRAQINGLSLYSERIFKTIKDQKSLLKTIQQGEIVVISEKEWNKLPPEITQMARVIESFPFRQGKLLLVRPALVNPNRDK